MNNKLDFSKKNRIRKGVRIVLPASLFFGGVGSGVVYLNNAFYNRPNSFFEQTYDHLFKDRIYKNNYQTHQEVDHDGFQVKKKPRWYSHQLVELKSNDFQYQPNSSHSNNAYDFNLNSSNKKADYTVFDIQMDFDQFLKTFKNRLNPTLNFAFSLKVENNDQSKVIENLAFGFDINDFTNLKDHVYDVFEYDLSQEQDFSDLNLKIKGQLETHIDRQNNFKAKFKVLGENIENPNLINSVPNQINTQSSSSILNPASTNPQSIKLTFQSPTMFMVNGKNQIQPNMPSSGNNPFNIFVLWDANARNDYQKWFWSAPDGPSNDPKIIAPDEAGVNIDSKKYTLTKGTSDQKPWLEMKYQKLSNLTQNDINNAFISNGQSGSTPTKQTIEIYKIVMTKDQLNQHLYQGLGSPTTNPALKVEFNLELDVMEAYYGQRQKYISTFFGIFDTLKITKGSHFAQTFVNYDLQIGRQYNGGHFELELRVEHRLDDALEIKINAVGNRLYFKKGDNEASKIPDDQYKLQFRPFDLNLVGYQNKEGKQKSNTVIVPQTNFGYHQTYNSNANTFIENINIKNPNGTTKYRSAGYLGIFKSRDPWVKEMNKHTTGWLPLDITKFTQNKDEYAKKATLTFYFRSLYTIGSLDFNPYSMNENLENLVVYNQGYDDHHHPVYKKKIFNRKNFSNVYNKFQIPVKILYDFLTKNPSKPFADYTWRQMFSFDRSMVVDKKHKHVLDPNDPDRGENAEYLRWKTNIYDWKNPTYDGGNSFLSGAYVRYRIAIKFEKTNGKINPKKIYYQLQTEAFAYQWEEHSNYEAGVGRAGFGVGKIDVNIIP